MKEVQRAPGHYFHLGFHHRAAQTGRDYGSHNTAGTCIDVTHCYIHTSGEPQKVLKSNSDPVNRKRIAHRLTVKTCLT